MFTPIDVSGAAPGRLRIRVAAATVLTVLVVTAGLARAETYYIAPEGSNRGEGTKSGPFGSFNHAIDQSHPGDTIYVRGGTYDLSGPVRIDRAGTRDRPIKLFAAPGEEPILGFSSNPRHADPPQPREVDTVAATGDAVGILVAGGARWWHIRAHCSGRRLREVAG